MASWDFQAGVVVVIALSLLYAAGCTEDGGTTPPDEENPTYLPNTDGSYWVYSHQLYQNNVPFGDPASVTFRFDGSAVVDGEAVQRLVRTVDGLVQYEVFLTKDNERNTYGLYGREYYDGSRALTDYVYFDPPWSWIQYPLSVGTNWQVTNVLGISPVAVGLPADIDKDGKDDLIDVEINCSAIAKEDVTTLVGVFTNAYKVRREMFITYHLTQGGTSALEFRQYFWFKPEKGIVKMSGDDIAYPNGPRYTYESLLSDYEIEPGS